MRSRLPAHFLSTTWVTSLDSHSHKTHLRQRLADRATWRKCEARVETVDPGCAHVGLTGCRVAESRDEEWDGSFADGLDGEEDNCGIGVGICVLVALVTILVTML